MALDEQELSVNADEADGHGQEVVWRQNPGEDIAPAVDAVAREVASEGLGGSEAKTADKDAPYGLIGMPLGHSWSPQIHGLLGSAPYALHELDEAGARAFIANGQWRGLNVTIPYKRLAAEVADKRSPAVESMGAANTLVRLEDGTVLAENTDVWGFRWLLDRFCEARLGRTPEELLSGAKAVVLGTGGASEAVAYVLRSAGAKVVRISRTGEESYDTLTERHSDAVLLVNTTPRGMFPHCPDSALTLDQLRGMGSLVGVVDIVYNPERSGLVLMAEKLGIPAEGGLPMLVAQAFRASELFQGKELPEDLLERVLATVRKQRRNVFFIGMPGCGKTGAGRRMARMCQRPFVDIDDAFEVATSMSPAAYITQKGEAAFRDKETEVLASYAMQSGLVVACGGGVVERTENLDLLRENGTVVFLDRPLEELSTAGRPLSAARGVEEIARRRMDLYRDWADLEVRCTGSAEGDAVLVKNLLFL